MGWSGGGGRWLPRKEREGKGEEKEEEKEEGREEGN